jgi:flagellar motor switch protein FliG
VNRYNGAANDDELADPLLEKEAQLFEEIVSLPEESRARLLKAIQGFDLLKAAFDAEKT